MTEALRVTHYIELFVTTGTHVLRSLFTDAATAHAAFAKLQEAFDGPPAMVTIETACGQLAVDTSHFIGAALNDFDMTDRVTAQFEKQCAGAA